MCVRAVSLIFMTLPGPSAAKRPALGQGRDLTLSPRSFADFVKKLTVSAAVCLFIYVKPLQNCDISLRY